MFSIGASLCCVFELQEAMSKTDGYRCESGYFLEVFDDVSDTWKLVWFREFLGAGNPFVR